MQLPPGPPVDLGPAGPDHRPHTRDTPGARGEDEQRPVGEPLLGADQQPGDRGGGEQGDRAQDAALSVPVDQP